MRLTAESLGWNLVIQRKLGEGGQGAVYLVDSPQGPFVVKWYNSHQATESQRRAIEELVRHGPPRKAASRFIWPKALVTQDGSPRFGYLMPLIDTQRFAGLGDVWSRRRPAPDLATLCEISGQMSSSYRALHLDGFCYRDISRGNLMFDPQSGDVLICDNDNVGINNASDTQVWGTMEYMAPELVRADAGVRPSTQTDLHSLAVLLFQLWVWHHPLHGQMEYDCRCWDLPAQRRVYGESPLFVFHHRDRRNALPNDPEYQTAGHRWAMCPPALQELFHRAFDEGLNDPQRRVTEGEWQKLFRMLSDGVVSCGCRAVNLWDVRTQLPVTCWHCGNPVALPPGLFIRFNSHSSLILLSRKARIRQWHLNPYAEDSDAVLGEVAQHPTDPRIWGLRNLTLESWLATRPDGTSHEVPPRKATTLEAGLKINMAGAVAEVRG